MWNIKELKEKGKAAFQANYWRSVLAGLALMLASGATLGSASSRSSDVKQSLEKLDSTMSNMDPAVVGGIVLTVLGVLGVVLVTAILLDVFLFNPLDVGCRRFFIENGKGPADVNEVGYAFKSNYKSVVLTIFLRDLYLGLWFLLCLIPGVVKTYSYRLVPYIMADDPTVSGNEAIRLSRELMNGHKKEAFLLDLSFLGWDILAIITFGLAGVFYSNPYQYATGAELYRAIRYGSHD